MWDQTRWTSLPEKTSLAVGLALTDSVGAVAPVLEYVTQVWGQAASDPTLLESMESLQIPPYGWPYSISFDLRFRQKIIASFLGKRAVDDIRVLAQDPDQPAMLRLYLLLKMYGVWVGSTEIKIEALEQLRSEFNSLTILARIGQAQGW